MVLKLNDIKLTLLQERRRGRQAQRPGPRERGASEPREKGEAQVGASQPQQEAGRAVETESGDDALLNISYLFHT